MEALPSLVAVCVSALCTLACGSRVDSEPTQRPADTPLSTGGDCANASPSDGFVNRSIGYEANQVWIEFDATPDAAPLDGVIGFSDGPADAFSDLAAAVRFSPDGIIDARDGDTYRVYPGTPLTYQAGVTYHFRIELNISTHTYQASVFAPDGSFSWLAFEAAFRPTQQSALQLTNSAIKVDSAAGNVSVCNQIVTYHDECMRIDAGASWMNHPAWPVVGTATFTALMKPTQANVDAVVGLSDGPADSFTDLAAIVRFNPNGMVDARNGSSYTAAESLPYTAGTLYPVSMYLDVRQHRYSAVVGSANIAQNYAFRTEQSGVQELDDASSFIDSPSGGLILCNPQLMSTDRALYRVSSNAGQLAAGKNGKLYEMDGSAVTVRDASTGAAIGTAPLRGLGRTDSAGNLYLAGDFNDAYDPGTGPLASSGGYDIFVAKYDAELHPIWARSFGTTADDVFDDLAIDGLGRAIVVGSTIGTVVLDSSGQTIRQTPESASSIAANGSGELALVGQRMNGTTSEVWVEKQNASGETLWQKTFAVESVSRVALSDSGDVIFSGFFHGTANFGGDDLIFHGGGEGPARAAYLVKLSGSGAHAWSLLTYYHYQLSDVTVDHAGNVTFSGAEGSQVLNPTVIKYAGADGSLLWRQSEQNMRGKTSSIATDDAGAIYWSFSLDDYYHGTSELLLSKLAP